MKKYRIWIEKAVKLEVNAGIWLFIADKCSQYCLKKFSGILDGNPV